MCLTSLWCLQRSGTEKWLDKREPIDRLVKELQTNSGKSRSFLDLLVIHFDEFERCFFQQDSLLVHVGCKEAVRGVVHIDVVGEMQLTLVEEDLHVVFVRCRKNLNGHIVAIHFVGVDKPGNKVCVTIHQTSH